MDDKSIKKNIAGLRKKSGLTQTELADRIGISRTAYRNLESGFTRILNENIDKVAEVLDRPVEEVVLGYEPLSPSHGVEDVNRKGYSRRGSMLDEVESMAGLKEQNAYLKEQYEILKEQNELMKSFVESLREIISAKDELLDRFREEKEK